MEVSSSRIVLFYVTRDNDFADRLPGRVSDLTQYRRSAFRSKQWEPFCL